MRTITIGASLVLALTLNGCAMRQVHQEDIDAWRGHPVADLEKHPVFITMRQVRFTASDGTLIVDVVNSRNVATCSGGGTTYGGSYNDFMNCMQHVTACHAVFYVRGGTIESVSAIGTGGMRCYTDATFRPGFSGVANIN
jgi:hypothetical protein